MNKRRLSVIIPVYNEASGISSFLDSELLPELKKLNYAIEPILINDGSTDKSLEAITNSEFSKAFNCKIISFTRNFGKEMALTAGLNNAKGDLALMIDADGQHPVSAIPTMIKKWENGAKVVTAIAKNKHTEHRFGSKMFYLIMKLIGNKTMKAGVMDFRVLDCSVIEEFNKFTEHNRISRGLIDWLGFKQEYIEVKTRGRESGFPTYSLKKLINLALNSFASTSRAPLMLFGGIGIAITLISGLLGLFILIEQYILGDPLGLDWAGAVAVSVFVAFLVGLVLISQSITALYISQIHNESKARPLYVIDRQKSKGI